MRTDGAAFFVTQFEVWKDSVAGILSRDAMRPSRFRAMVGLLVFLTAGARLLAIRAPALDRTYWKEIDYIAISSNYRDHGFRFHRPEITWPAEEPRVTAMEFPLVPYVAALSYVPGRSGDLVMSFNPGWINVATRSTLSR